MDLQLSTSDLVALFCMVVQLVATVVIAIWTVNRTLSATSNITPTESASANIKIGLKIIRWLALVLLVFGIHILWTGANSTEPITKGFLFKSLLFSFSIVFSLLASILMSLVNHFLDRIGRVIQLVGMQGDLIGSRGELKKDK